MWACRAHWGRLGGPVQYILLIILLGALGVGIVVLARLAWSHRRRRRKLARFAHETDLRFSADESFDLIGRYGDFVAVTAGHSPCVENVLSGRRGRWQFRVFDYHFEAGHGPGRVLRRYSMMIAETGVDLPDALLWHGDDLEQAPLAARYPSRRVGPWYVIDGADCAEILTDALSPLAGAPVSIQTRGRSVMLIRARPLRPAEAVGWVSAAAAAVAAAEEGLSA